MWVGCASPVVLGQRWIGIVASFAPLLPPVATIVSLSCCGGLWYGFSILGVDGCPSLTPRFAKETLLLTTSENGVWAQETRAFGRQMDAYLATYQALFS